MSEAVDCWECNSSLQWEGDIPDDETDIVCHACSEDRMRARIAALEAERDGWEKSAHDAARGSIETLMNDRAALRAKLEAAEQTAGELRNALGFISKHGNQEDARSLQLFARAALARTKPGAT